MEKLMSAPSAGVEMEATIDGLVVSLVHQPSQQPLRAVPPKDNGGDGSSFSPTDLVGAALASCMLATMALLSAREGLEFGKARAKVVKHMSPPPRRIERLDLDIWMPSVANPSHRQRLEEIAHTCPVARSLSVDVAVSIRFHYP
jgi:putative redox protein